MCILQNSRNIRGVLEHIYTETIDIPTHLGEVEDEELEIDVQTVEVVSHNQFPGAICFFKIDINDTLYFMDGLYESVNRESTEFEKLFDLYAKSPFNLDLCHYMITNKEFFPHNVEFLATADTFSQPSSTMAHMTDCTRNYFYVIRLQIYTGEEVDDNADITIYDKHVLTIKKLKDFMEEDMTLARTDIKTFYIIVEHNANENVNQSYNFHFTINFH